MADIIVSDTAVGSDDSFEESYAFIEQTSNINASDDSFEESYAFINQTSNVQVNEQITDLSASVFQSSNVQFNDNVGELLAEISASSNAQSSDQIDNVSAHAFVEELNSPFDDGVKFISVNCFSNDVINYLELSSINNTGMLIDDNSSSIDITDVSSYSLVLDNAYLVDLLNRINVLAKAADGVDTVTEVIAVAKLELEHHIRVGDIFASSAEATPYVSLNVNDAVGSIDTDVISNVILIVNEFNSSSDLYNISADIDVLDSSLAVDESNIKVDFKITEVSQTTSLVNSQIYFKLSDFELANEVIGIVRDKMLSISETGTGSDSIKSFVDILINDYMQGNSLLSLEGIGVVSDDANFADDTIVIDTSLSMGDVIAVDVNIHTLRESFLKIADAGQGLDNVLLNVNVKLTDTNYNSEITEIKNALSVLQNVEGIEIISDIDGDDDITRILFSFNTRYYFEYEFKT